MNENKNLMILVVLLLAGFAANILTIQRSTKSDPYGIDVRFTRKLATSMESKGLYANAVKEYAKLLASSNLDPKERAGIGFRVAEIYLDRLKNPDGALPYLLATKIITEELMTGSELDAKVDKRIVEALEKSGRTIDAANYLASASSIDPNENAVSTAEVIIAKIGSRNITLRDLEDEIQTLPPQLQEQFKGLDARRELLSNYIAKQLLLIAAERAGLNDDPSVERAARTARENAILAKYQQMEVDSKIWITESDVRAYYEANKDNFSVTDDEGNKTTLTYDDVKDRARGLLENQKRRAIIDQTINRLRQSEGVEVHIDRLEAK